MEIVIVPLLITLLMWWRMISDLRGGSTVFKTIVYTVMTAITSLQLVLIVSILSYMGEFADPSNIFRHLQMGTVIALLVSLALLYLITKFIIHILLRHKPQKSGISTKVYMVLAGILIILFINSYFREIYALKAVSEDIYCEDLDPRLDGLRIALISDLHLSSFYGHYDKLRELTDKINSFTPDILVNAGDFISYGWQEYGGCDTILSRAVSSVGAFAVLGNHDDGTYYPGYDSDYGKECYEMLVAKAEVSGYTILNDTSMTISYHGVPLRIAGIVTHGHRLNMRYGSYEKATIGRDSCIATILIAHDPEVWGNIKELSDAPLLTLSGHTHGMQLGIPWPGRGLSPAALIHKYWRGLYEDNGRYLYVSSGAGSMGMLTRIFMPTEIVFLTIRSNPSSGVSVRRELE